MVFVKVLLITGLSEYIVPMTDILRALAKFVPIV